MEFQTLIWCSIRSGNLILAYNKKNGMITSLLLNDNIKNCIVTDGLQMKHVLTMCAVAIVAISVSGIWFNFGITTAH